MGKGEMEAMAKEGDSKGPCCLGKRREEVADCAIPLPHHLSSEKPVSLPEIKTKPRITLTQTLDARKMLVTVLDVFYCTCILIF